MGYLAPELVRTGKATPSTDVFAFGVFLLEVVCGRRPIERGEQSNRVILVDWVLEHHRNGSITDTVDPRFMGKFSTEEVTLVLKLGLLCAHPSPNVRPSVRKVMQYLDGAQAVPDISPTYTSYSMMALMQNEGFDSYIMSCSASATSVPSVSGGSSVTVLVDGR
jgi:serine/threonine protein kinase